MATLDVFRRPTDDAHECDALKVFASSSKAKENWATTGGGGGLTMQGGDRGNSDIFDWVEDGGGTQGGITSPHGGETSMPIVFKGTRYYRVPCLF